ncbi:MAG TPA: type II toxin-antitoxin system HigB family toxin [Bacteroidia bacterium]
MTGKIRWQLNYFLTEKSCTKGNFLLNLYIFMRVRLFREDTVEEFMFHHANGRKHFEAFLTGIRYADWNEPNDIIRTINSNLLGDGSNRVVFDIGGNGRNAYRIIGEYSFNHHYKKSNTYKVHLYINWIGTHEDYNNLTNEQKLTTNDY